MIVPLRVLVWFPVTNLSGGLRFAAQLTNALAADSDVERLRLAVPREMVARVQAVMTRGDVEIAALGSRWLDWTEQEIRVFGRGTARLRRQVRAITAPRGLPLQDFRRLSQDCDLIYVPWPHSISYIQTDKPVVCTFHDTIYFDFPAILGTGDTQREWRSAATWLSRASTVVVSSQSTLASLRKHFSDIRADVRMIRHNASPRASEPKTGRAGLPPLPEAYFVCVTNTSPHKNVYTLLMAWARFEGRRDTPLVLLGPGTDLLRSDSPANGYGQSEEERLRELIQRLGLEHGRDFYALGYLPDDAFADVLRGAVALITPTLAEGGGSFPVEEALAVGTPVLCSDIPVMRETLADRAAQIRWFDPLSPDSICNAVATFARNRSLGLPSPAPANGFVGPTWSDIASEYVQVFEAALAGSRLESDG